VFYNTPGTFSATLTVTDNAGLTDPNPPSRKITVSPAPDFSISATPSSRSVVQGNSANYTVTISPSNGFSDTVSLSVGSLPSGANASFAPSTVSGQGSSTLNVATSSSTPAGNYTLKITGSTASLSHSVTVNLAVTSNLKTPVVYDSEKLPAVSSGPTFRQFSFAGFPDGVGTILDATKVGDNVTFTLNVAQPGTYDVKVGVKKYTTRGIWQLSLNGVNVGSTQDEYVNTGGTYAVLDVGTVTISSAGNQSFRFTVTGKDVASSGFTMSFDTITLTPQ
jgi:uncharacterized membrane protein